MDDSNNERGQALASRVLTARIHDGLKDMSEPKLDELAWCSLTKPDTVQVEDFGLTHDDVRELCDFHEGRPFFRDPEEARSRAVRHIKQSVIAPEAATPSAFFKALERCWFDAGPVRQENLVGLALAQVHNTGEFDALQMAIEAIQGGGDVFTVSRVMTDSLPLFDGIDVPNLLILFGLMHPNMKNDLAQGFLYIAAGEWMKGHPAFIDEVVRGGLAVAGESSAPLLRAALVQGVASDRIRWLTRIHELVDDNDPTVSLPAIEALGLVDWHGADAEDIARAVAVIRAGLRSDDESVLVSSACAGMNLVDTAHDQHALVDEVVALDRRYVVRLVGDHLGYRGAHLRTRPWYPEKITLLASKTGQNEESYRGVDMVLSHLFKSQEKAACQRWLDTWASANAHDAPDFPEEFPQLFQLMSESGEDLGALLARWLRHDEVGVQKMARHVLEDAGLQDSSSLGFPPSVLDGMTPAALMHLVRRVLGNVFRDGQQISLIWSLTQTADAEDRSYGLVHDAMAGFVGRDYPAATKAHLESVVAGDATGPLMQLAQGILAEMKEYQDTLDALPRVEELRPLAEQHHRFVKERRRQMSEAFDEASKNSIWRQIATTIPLKAGRSSFSVTGGEVGEKLHLSSMSHSVSIPRSEAIDRIGSDLRRMHFNLGKDRDEQ